MEKIFYKKSIKLIVNKKSKKNEVILTKKVLNNIKNL